MKFLLSILPLLLLAASTPLEHDDKIHIPEKCEDVLSVKVCNQLKKTAINLKLTSAQVKEAVIDAVKNGKTKTEDIIKSAKDFLQQKVLSKKCEDFTTSDTCNKLRTLAGKLKLKAGEVEKFVIKAVAEGSVKTAELYQKVLEYYKNEIATKKCEDFLTNKQCERIRQGASALKIKADKIEKVITDAILKGYVEGKDSLKEALEMLKDLAKNTSCEDLLNPDVCKKLRRYANLTKIGFPKLMETVRDVIVKGYSLGKGLLKAIYAVTDYFYDCTDVFDKTSCDRLKYWLGKLGMKAAEIDRIVREYAKKGIAKATELYKKIYDFLKQKFVCKISPWCKSSSNIVTREINMMSLKRNSALLALEIPKVKETLRQHLKDILENVKTVSAETKKKLEEILLAAKVKSAIVAKFLKDLFKIRSSGKIDWITRFMTRITKRDVTEQLEDALEKTHAEINRFIKKLLTASREYLKKAHITVKSVFNKLLQVGQTKREIGNIDAMEVLAETLINESFKEIQNAAEEEADFRIDTAILENDANTTEDDIQRRDVSEVLKKTKEVYREFKGKFQTGLDNIKTLNLNEFKKTLENASNILVGSLEELDEQITKMI